jgi:hypothetical protein
MEKISTTGFALNESNVFKAKIDYSGSKSNKEVPILIGSTHAGILY